MSALAPIIIIEDDQDDQELVKQVCDRLKIQNQLLFFDNGEVVLHYLATTPEHPFLILCDMNMPMVDGMNLRRRIEEDEQLKRKAIPFIFLTTSATKTQVNEAYDLPIQGFFEKGSSLEELKHRIELIMAYWKTCKHPNSF